MDTNWWNLNFFVISQMFTLNLRKSTNVTSFCQPMSWTFKYKKLEIFSWKRWGARQKPWRMFPAITWCSSKTSLGLHPPPPVLTSSQSSSMDGDRLIPSPRTPPKIWRRTPAEVCSIVKRQSDSIVRQFLCLYDQTPHSSQQTIR